MITFDFQTYQHVPTEDCDLSDIKERFLKDNKMSGWYDLDTSCVPEIMALAHSIRKQCDVFLVIGIGGSYMGAKAVIDAMAPYFSKEKPEVLFAGFQLSSDYLSEIIDYLEDKEVIVNVISKSGTTLEPLAAFEKILPWMKKKYGEEYYKRVIVTTDEHQGDLVTLAKNTHMRHLIVPDNIGGRFSVLTTVGLLPIAVAGYDIQKLFTGAQEAKQNFTNCYLYTYLRNYYYKHGKVIESFDIYEPKLSSFAEWLKQLFGESQGKEGKGLFPVSTMNTRDLHSLGQYYQDGPDVLFSTILFTHSTKKVFIEKYQKDLDKINQIAMESVAQAHLEGHVPSLLIMLDTISLENLGYLIFFFEMSAMLGSYLLDVPYYDQPGVNAYKTILKERVK